ncbi:MAG: LD-carboxypeptidase, partial [Oscillospiraceae bacterium]|nr:LD-carboxypeptidase [Oscillospiraceae bacterium]
MIFPSKLQKNDTILLAAPCSPLPPDQTPELVAEAVERLGFRVKIGASCRAETARGYSAAPAEVRARDINEGFADPAVDAIWCIRGG